ncbi:MAG: FAD-dependent oxidoreductase [Chthoniobacterales bacterium]|nr:MAG: FAD-dependent oxidoreductase [Chthoniobacterales bacterium]
MLWAERSIVNRSRLDSCAANDSDEPGFSFIMARTPFFQDIQRALRVASWLEQTRTGTVEGLERLEEAAWSRRRFLRTAAAVTAGAALAPIFKQAAHAAQTPRVVIIGAGTAGLICAYRLQQKDIGARVIEASTRAGGRMFSLRNFFPDNQLTELGGEYIDSGHKTMRRLVQELGLTLNDLGNEKNPGGGHTYFFNGRLVPVDADFIEMFRPVARAISDDLKRMKVRNEISYDSPHAREVDRLSLPEWFEKRGVTGLMTSVLRAAYVGEYGLEIDQQSALNLLLTIGDAVPANEFRIFGESDERFHIAEGNDSVPGRLAQRLERPVEFGTRLEAITAEGEGYRLALRNDEKSTELKADILVLALPFTILRQLEVRVKLPEAKRKAIHELGYGTNAKLIAGFSRRVWEEAHSTGYTFTDLEFQCCWETSRGQPGSQAILTNFAGGKLGQHLNEGDVQDRAAAFASQIERIYPGAQEAFTKKAVRQHWPSSPFVLGSYTCYKPGQYSTLADAIATPIGNMFFAGEHTSVDFNGYMEGAAETGERAAKEVLAKIRGRK